MQIRLLQGREFSDADSSDRPAVTIVNQAFAQRFFPNRNPVGEHLSATVRGERKDLEIIGVAENTYSIGLRVSPRPMVYVAYAQLNGDVPTTITVRTSGSLTQTSRAIEQVLQSRLPNTPVEVRPLSAQVGARMVQERMLATLASGFGLLALVVACVGVYGLQAYGVARRIKEIGIRLALGAEPHGVIASVLVHAARLVLLGIAIGVPLAFGASRWIESMLFGLKPTDLTTTAVAIMLLLITAQVAASVPAWMASRVDPLTALRHD
jgi:ABC-type antimicrobial peptide transport system permease subunit